MWCYGIALVTLACLSSVTAVDFVSGPENVIIPIGGTARLKCAVDLNTVRGSLTLYWYKAQDGGGYYITGGSEIYARNLGAERYSLETSSANGEYSYVLKIRAVEALDSGQYQCMAVDTRGFTRSSRGTLSVVQASTDEPLTCNYYPESPTVGETVTFSCTAPRGISPEMLSWWMAGTVRIEPSAHLSNNHGISFVKTLTNADNFAEFTCLVGTSFDTARSMNCSVMPLAVPIRAEVTPQNGLALVGSTATFRCRGTAVPPVTRYRWIYGSGRSTVKLSASKGRYTVINNGDSSTLTIGGISMQDNGYSVRCVVMNEITKTIGSAILQVTTSLPTRQPTTSLMSSSSSPVKTTNIKETPSQPMNPIRSTDLTSSSQPTPPIKTTGTVSGSTKQQISTTSQNGDVINHFGCSKDCGEKISSQQNPDKEEGSSNSALAAALSILAICALATGVIVYIAYTRRGRTSGRVIKRKWKNKPLQRLRSLRLSVSNPNPEIVNPDSVRLKTIEVIVNSPPPEWQNRVKDVESGEKEPKEESVPRLVLTPECDALYAKPDKMRKKRHHVDNGDDVHPVATAPPAVPGQYLSTEADDCFSDDVSDASTWDMSSVDSGCEEETEEVHEDAAAYAELDLTAAGQGAKEYIPQTETVEYENTMVTKTSLPRN